MVLVVYARVSPRDQPPEAQLDALSSAGCERTFTDQASGTLARRPALDEALSYLRAGDTLVVTKLDRLRPSGRNPQQGAGHPPGPGGAPPGPGPGHRPPPPGG